MHLHVNYMHVVCCKVYTDCRKSVSLTWEARRETTSQWWFVTATCSGVESLSFLRLMCWGQSLTTSSIPLYIDMQVGRYICMALIELIYSKNFINFKLMPKSMEKPMKKLIHRISSLKSQHRDLRCKSNSSSIVNGGHHFKVQQCWISTFL